MRRVAMVVVVVVGLVPVPALADAWTEFFRYGGFPGLITEGSSVLQTPWGPSVLHSNAGDGGCAYSHEPSSGFDVDFDAAFLGLPGVSARVSRSSFSPEPEWYLTIRAQCVEVMGRTLYLESSRGEVSPSVLSLPSPLTHRCNTVHGSVHFDVVQPVTERLEIAFSYGCGPDRVPSEQPLVLSDVRLKMLAGWRATESPPSHVDLIVPERVCGRRFTGDVTLDVPPVGGAFLFIYRPAPAADAWWSAVREGELSRRVPFDARARTEVLATVSPLDAPLPEVSRTVRILPWTDPACFVLPDIQRFIPRWDGCWNCVFRTNAWRAPLIINGRMMSGPVMRALNGVVARNGQGGVASVSENAAGFPTSFITSEDAPVQEFPGIHLRALSEQGLAAGARVDPKAETRTAIWFDGKAVHELGTLGGDSSEALALAEEGWLVGWAEDESGARRAFLAKDNTLEALPLPPHLESEATSIGGARWISGTLLTTKGRQGFLFDLETGEVHLTDVADVDAAYRFIQVNERGWALGSLTSHNQEVVPVLFSAETGLVRLDTVADLPQGFIVDAVLGLSDDGSVLLSGWLEGEQTYLRFSH